MNFEKEVLYIDIMEDNHINKDKQSRAFRFHSYLHNNEKHSILKKGDKKGWHRFKSTGGDNFYFKRVENKQRIPYGDYLFNDFCFEFKTAYNLISDIHNGHMQQQIEIARKGLDENQIKYYCVIVSDRNYLSFNHDNFFSNKIPLGINYIPLNTEEDCFKFMINAWLDNYKGYTGVVSNYEQYNPALNALKPYINSKNNLTKLFNKHHLFTIADLFNLSEENFKSCFSDKKASEVYKKIHKKTIEQEV